MYFEIQNLRNLKGDYKDYILSVSAALSNIWAY